MSARSRETARRAVWHLAVLALLLAAQTRAVTAQLRAADDDGSTVITVNLRTSTKDDQAGGRDKSSRNKSGGGSSKSSRNKDEPLCGNALWMLAKEDPDLQVLVAVQQLTTLNFFTPFGKESRRHFTLLAPTDQAFFKAFNGTSGAERQALKNGFPALLLYHQYLGHGYSVQELAQQFDIVTALGSLVNEQQLKIDIDKYGDDYIVSGMVPDNYAGVVREDEACGNHLILLDMMLQPMAELSQLPKLQSMDPIKSSQWEQILGIMHGSTTGDSPAEGPGPKSAPQQGGSSSNDGIGGGDGDVMSLPRNQGPDMLINEGSVAAPAAVPTAAATLPLPPGAVPDCASLAASGRLINETGSLAHGCGSLAVDSMVMNSGTTQTVVSDGGQIDPKAQPPPPPPSATTRASCLAAVVLAAQMLAWLLLLLHAG